MTTVNYSFGTFLHLRRTVAILVNFGKVSFTATDLISHHLQSDKVALGIAALPGGYQNLKYVRTR